MKTIHLGMGVLLLMLASTLLHAGLPGMSPAEDDIPAAEDAFRVMATELPDTQQIQVGFTLHPGVYLYRHRLAFRLLDLDGNLLADFAGFEPPEGEPKDDEIFGRVQVFHDSLDVMLPLASVPLVPARLEVDYQGCLEDVLCYPPQTARLPINFVPAPAAVTPPSSAGLATDNFMTVLESEDASAFSRWMGGQGAAMIALLFFTGGLLLAFTPCVFPMIPILSGIIAGAANPSAGKGFVLSSAYVLGVAIPYTLAGMLVALFGAGMNLQYMLQQPAAIIVSALIFMILALGMFGMYELQLPGFLRQSLSDASQKQRGGSLLGAALMGAISALVVSPCVTPILAGALIYVAGSGDVGTGALSLFSLSIGMGVPLILVGTGGAHLLPHAGGWMDEIRRFFGVLMLGVAIWLLDRILGDSLALGLYGLLLAAYGVYLGALEPVPEDGSRLKRALALIMALYGAIMVVGAAGGGTDPLQPLHPPATARIVDQAGAAETEAQAQAQAQAQAGQWQTVGAAGLQPALDAAAAQGRPVLVDFFAEWCASCKVLEETTLTHPRVLAAMEEYVLIRVDITEITRQNREIMEKYNIIGLPCLVFFDGEGNEVQGKRILGEMGPERFLEHLATF